MKVRLFFWILILLSLKILSSKDLLAEGSSSSSNPAVTIGANLPLTGQLATVGISAQRGIAMALDKAKSEYPSINFNVQIEDNAGDPKIGVSVLRKLLASRPQIIFSRTTHITKAIAPIVAESGAVLFYGSTVRDIAESNPLFFRDYMDAEDNGVIVAQQVNRFNRKRVVYLGEQSDACEVYRKAFLAQYSGEVLRTELFAPGERDFRPLLIKLRGTTPDAMVLCTWRDTALLMRQLKEIKSEKLQTFHLAAPFLPENDSKDVREILEKGGAISTWYDVAISQFSPERVDFNNRYREIFGEEARTESAYVYDDFMLIAKTVAGLLEKGESVTPTLIARDLLTARHAGISGELHFDKNGVSRRVTKVISVVNGEWTAQ